MPKPGEGSTFEEDAAPRVDLPGPSDLTLVQPDLVGKVDQMVEASERQAMLMLGAAVKQTQPQDWIDQGGGVVYLQDSGAARVNRIWNISFSEYRFDPVERETVKMESVRGKKVPAFEVEHYMYTCTGSGCEPRSGRVEWSTGMFATAFPFMRGRYEEACHQGKVGDMMRMRAEAKRSSVTAMHGKIIRRIAGLEGLTVDDLKRIGMDTGRIGKVERRESQPAAKRKDGKETRAGAMTPAQFGKLMHLIEENVSVPEGEDARNALADAHLTKQGAGEMIEGLDAVGEEKLTWPKFLAALKKRATPEGGS